MPALATPVTVGRVTAEFRPSGGLYLTYDGVPVIRGQILQVFARDPKESFSSGGHAAAVRVNPLPNGGQEIVASYASDGSAGARFTAEEHVQLLPGDRVTLRLDATWRGTQPGTFEWAAGKLWAYPLVGAPWSASSAEGGSAGTAAGTVSRTPGAADYRAATLAGGFTRLDLRARPFGLTVTPGADSPDTLFFDGRGNPGDWASGDRLFWLGYVGAPAPNTGSFSRSLTLQLSPGAITWKVAPALTATTARVVPLAVAQSAPDGPPLVIPQPKHARYTQQPFALGGASIQVARSVDPRVHRAARELAADFGIPFHDRVHMKAGGRAILVTVAGADRAAGRLAKAAGATPPIHAEGYRLTIQPRRVLVVGRDAAGAFYGLQTLRQLVRPAGSGLRLLGADIEDWPSLAFRGADLFLARNPLPFHKKLIERIFSRYKLNNFVLECEYTRWDTHPDIAVDFSMSKRDLAADVAFARAHFMEPTPLINSLGHAEWMFKNGKNAELSEDPDHRAAYCPSKEDTYRFLFDIYDEALALFKPKYFHIGHDEITLFSRFPYDATCRAAGATQEEAITNLLLRDIGRIDGWLAARHVRTMLWSDMFLHRSESSDDAANAASVAAAEDRRKRLRAEAGDVVIGDWHYQPTPQSSFGSISTFQREGLPAIATTWYQPDNIANFARAAIAQHAMGLLQTTWAGYDSSEATLRENFQQFTAFILAAEYAWSGNPVPPSKLPWQSDAVFRAQWSSDGSVAARPGWALDLRAAYNAALPALAGLPVEATTADGARLRFEHGTGGANAVLLAGQMNPDGNPRPSSVIIPVGRHAATLVLAHASLFPAAGKQSGVYTIALANGHTFDVPLRDGENIEALDGRRPLWSAGVAWRGRDAEGQPVRAQALRWRNPEPRVAIRSITLRATDPVAAPMLLGVTGIP